jgi:antitoxin component YwqK of YwqJK toxin-antitoxin module
MGIFDWFNDEKDNSNDSVLRIHSDDLENIEDVNHYKGTPFTGIYYNLYPNGNLLFESEQLEGKDHGRSKRYKVDGTIHSVVNFHDGKIHDEDKEKEDEFTKYMLYEVTSQIENKDENKKTGPEKIYHENGQLKEEGEYRDGVEEGLWKTYHENGQLLQYGEYKNGKKEGLWKTYHENGQLEIETNIINGEYDGIWKRYYKNGQLVEEGNHDNGVDMGYWKSYYENGQLHFEGYKTNGQQDGLWKVWYDSGKLQRETHIKNGERDGGRKHYYENGQLEIEESYKNNELEGIWKSYYKDGQRQSEGNYTDGKKNGLWKEYNHEGKLDFEGKYKNGIEDGWSKYKKIDTIFDYNDITFFQDDLKEIIDLDFEKNDIELYLGYKYEHRWSVFQCIKSEENKSTKKISKYDEDEHVRDGKYDPEYVKESFDETNEVHDGYSYSVWLSKINSNEFITNFQEKIKSLKDHPDWKDEESFYFSEFIEWIEHHDNCPVLDDLYDNMGGNRNDLTSVLDEVDIDDEGNLISWYSYGQLDTEYFQIGYRKKDIEDVGEKPVFKSKDNKESYNKSEEIQQKTTNYKLHGLMKGIELLELGSVIEPGFFDKLDFKNKDLEFYLSHEWTYSGCVYQLEKSDLNTNTKIINEWKDDYLRDGDFYSSEDDFDKTNEVFEGNVSEQTLIKITSDKFPELLMRKINEFNNKYPEGDVDDLYEEIMGDNFTDSSEGLDHMMSFLGVNGDQIFYEDLTDDYGYIVKWVQYFQKDSYGFKIGFKERG